jgi:hypothetical protein
MVLRNMMVFLLDVTGAKRRTVHPPRERTDILGSTARAAACVGFKRPKVRRLEKNTGPRPGTRRQSSLIKIYQNDFKMPLVVYLPFFSSSVEPATCTGCTAAIRGARCDLRITPKTCARRAGAARGAVCVSPAPATKVEPCAWFALSTFLDFLLRGTLP